MDEFNASELETAPTPRRWYFKAWGVVNPTVERLELHLNECFAEGWEFVSIMPSPCKAVKNQTFYLIVGKTQDYLLYKDQGGVYTLE